MIKTGVKALGPEDCPASSGDEMQSQAWALGAVMFAGPGGEGLADALELPKGWGKTEAPLGA